VHIASYESRAAVTQQIEANCVCIHACSACSGDYEDPERTASSDAEAEELDDEEIAAITPRPDAREEFPVREE
jgi:hypothetical protein